MDIDKVITYLEVIKREDIAVELVQAIDSAIEIIGSKQKIVKELDKAIEIEKTTLDQFTDDFNHHLWIMRGLQIAKAIIEGKDYIDFIS